VVAETAAHVNTGPNPTVFSRLRLDTGEPVALGRMLGKPAGEGTIYEVASRPDWVAKIFHPTLTDLQAKLDKVRTMIPSAPPGVAQPNGFVVLTWPLHIVADDRGPIGYVMPRIDTATAVEIHTMSNPSDRTDPPPNSPQWTRNATWGHLLNTAANLCLAVEVVHRVDAVIGDFQERNILVANTTEVTLVDCDSMQFTDRSGRQYLCGVGRPEFTAPELAGINLRVQARQKPSDLFALAVHIHLLLMAGNHPFMRGMWAGEGDQPDALTLARTGHWAGGPSSLLHTHPLAPPITFLPNEIQQLFARAFTVGVHDPAQRPAAAEWRSALSRIQLTACPRLAHQVPVGCATCPWCAIDDERQSRRLRTGTTGPHRLPAATTGRQTVPGVARAATPARGFPSPSARGTPPKKAQDNPFGVSTRVLLAAILTVVLTVVALSAFIIWALLTGATTFGAASAGAAVQRPVAVEPGGTFIATGSGSIAPSSGGSAMVPPIWGLSSSPVERFTTENTSIGAVGTGSVNDAGASL
jgi:eukaryotic-like serine/threonine-protein kinase